MHRLSLERIERAAGVIDPVFLHTHSSSVNRSVTHWVCDWP